MSKSRSITREDGPSRVARLRKSAIDFIDEPTIPPSYTVGPSSNIQRSHNPSTLQTTFRTSETHFALISDKVGICDLHRSCRSEHVPRRSRTRINYGNVHPLVLCLALSGIRRINDIAYQFFD